MNGINSLKGRIIILDEAKLDYTAGQIKEFIELWNEGYTIGDIAEKFWIAKYEVALLVMHCELQGWIKPRKGGLKGTIPSRYQRMKMAKGE